MTPLLRIKVDGAAQTVINRYITSRKIVVSPRLLSGGENRSKSIGTGKFSFFGFLKSAFYLAFALSLVLLEMGKLMLPIEHLPMFL